MMLFLTSTCDRRTDRHTQDYSIYHASIVMDSKNTGGICVVNLFMLEDKTQSDIVVSLQHFSHLSVFVRLT